MRSRIVLALCGALTLGACGLAAASDGAAEPTTVVPPSPAPEQAVATQAAPASAEATAPGPALVSVTEAAATLDADLDGDVAAVVVDLTTGERADHRGSTTFTSASLYKLYVVATALDQVDRGELGIDTVVGGGCGSLGYAVELVVSVSDNVCAIRLGSLLGWREVEDYVQEQGFTGTTFSPVEEAGGWATTGQQTTADDTADLLVRLAEGELLSPASSELFLDQLEAQYFDSALSLVLEEDGAVFAHKLGTLEEVSHDAGILTVDGHRYVVAVLTGGFDGWAEPAAGPALAEVGEALQAYAVGADGSG